MRGNRKEIYGRGFGYVITRRILPNGTGLRVRVKAYEGIPSKYKTPVEDTYVDYDHLATGDAAFFRIIEQHERHVTR